MMGSCEGMSASLHRSRYISWCVDSAKSPRPAATTVAQKGSSHQNHQPAGAGSVPLLLLSPPEASGGETNAAFSLQRPEATFTKGTRLEAFTHPHPSPSNPHSGEDDDGEEEGRKGNEEELEDKTFFLPRSSPVISRRHRTVSWHGEDPGTSDPPRNMTSSSLDSRSPASGSLSLDQCGCPTVTRMADPGSEPSSCPRPSPLQTDKKPLSVSASSHLNRLLSPWVHRPFSGQQGLTEEDRRGRGLTSCDASHSSGLSTSTQHSKERRCSGIPEFSADIFKTRCDLEKENAHFIVVDMMLEVLEGAKWTLSSDRWTSTMDMRKHSHCNACTRGDTSSAEDIPPHGHKQRCKASRRTQTGDPQPETSHRNTHPSHVHTQQHTRDEEEEEAANHEAEYSPKTFTILSSDSGFEDCGVDTTLTSRESLRNAEWLAQQLVLEFKRSWLPSHEPRSGRLSLCSSLQELPGTGGVAVSSGSLAEEIRLRTRMRGSLSWAPPRFQIIFTVQPTNRRSEVVALQHFLCAGCGTEVEPRYIKKLRYCEYLGRYFCDCCHGGSEAVIPGRLLSCWDFGRYPVSDFSKQLLDSVWLQPLFDLTCVGKTLYSRVKELDKFRELQERLMCIKKLLSACRLSGRVMAEFEQLPAHLMEQPHLFSLDDLLRVKKGQLVAQARAVLHSAIDHVENCELCLARGFICEFCRERDVIFPFQPDICRRCPVCRACFHKHCFVEKKCPKCARIQSRKKKLPDGSMK